LWSILVNFGTPTATQIAGERRAKFSFSIRSGLRYSWASPASLVAFPRFRGRFAVVVEGSLKSIPIIYSVGFETPGPTFLLTVYGERTIMNIHPNCMQRWDMVSVPMAINTEISTEG
jgi:hypothetical protein